MRDALTGHGILEVENLESARHRGYVTGGWAARLQWISPARWLSETLENCQPADRKID